MTSLQIGHVKFLLEPFLLPPLPCLGPPPDAMTRFVKHVHLHVLLDSCSFCSQSNWNLADQLDISLPLQAAVKIMAKELCRKIIFCMK